MLDTEPASERSAPRVEHRLAAVSWLAPGLVIAAAFALRLWGLDHLPGINGDETYYGVHALEWIQGEEIALRSGSDLPLNAPFFGLVTLLHLVFPPGLALMRSATVIHSVATFALAYLLFAKRGRQFALLFAMLVAAMPVHLGYARLSWDPSAVPTVMVVALATATQRRLGLTALMFALLLWVHPTTVFALPILVAPFLVARTPTANERPPAPAAEPGTTVRAGLGRALHSPRVQVAVASAVLVLCAALVLGLREQLPSSVQNALSPARFAQLLARLQNPLDIAAFGLLFADFVSGLSTYVYLAGSASPLSTYAHRIGCVLLLAVGLLGVRRLRAARASSDLAVLYGVLASLCIAYPLSGLTLFLPHTARYAIFLTVPTCYVIAGWLDALASDARRAIAVRFGAAVLAASLLLAFHSQVLQALQRPDAGRADTFRTGEVDPKRLALEATLRMRTPQRRALVLTEDWWIYWTVRYLAQTAPELSVTITGMRTDYRFPADFVLQPSDFADADVFGIAWAGRRLDAHFRARAHRHADIFGFEPAPILRVHQLTPPRR